MSALTGTQPRTRPAERASLAPRRRFPPRGWYDVLRQLALWLGFGVAYELARGLADRGPDEALANARRVIAAERELGILVEADVQRPVVGIEPLLEAVNWTYWLAQFAVLGLALLWIYTFRTDAFFPIRNAIFAANIVGLAG
jgi:hypothetical protein